MSKRPQVGATARDDSAAEDADTIPGDWIEVDAGSAEAMQRQAVAEQVYRWLLSVPMTGRMEFNVVVAHHPASKRAPERVLLWMQATHTAYTTTKVRRKGSAPPDGLPPL